MFSKWRYGLGITAAFTSSTHSKWVPDWQDSEDWPYFTKFWGQLARSVMSVGTHKNVQAEVRSEVRRRRGKLMMDFYHNDGSFLNDLVKECKLFPPDASVGVKGISLPCRHVAPGKYEIDFDIEKFGRFYRIMLDDQKYELRRIFAFSQPYSEEYRQLSEQPDVLENIAKETGGVFEAAQEDVVSFPPPPKHKKAIWYWFLLIGLLLLPFDILSKRVLSFS